MMARLILEPLIVAVVAFILLFSFFTYIEHQHQEQLAFEQDCAAQSGQVQPDGSCVRVLYNVETGAYHLRPAR